MAEFFVLVSASGLGLAIGLGLSGAWSTGLAGAVAGFHLGVLILNAIATAKEQS